MLKFFTGFWQCIFGQLILVGIIDLIFSTVGAQSAGYFKFMLFLLINFHFRIEPHRSNCFNPFLFSIKLRKDDNDETEQITK